MSERALPQKLSQAGYFDHVPAPEFEIERPNGQSRFYRYLMAFKFARVTGLMRERLAGHSVLTICCGSGMDAEFLARAGGTVVALDISQGALERARERADRHGVSYRLVRADAERLPFADRSFDYVFVHDGLHHLPDPGLALGEMARTARLGLIITEPADALFTRLAVRLRLAQAFEEAGNFVFRFTPEALELACRRLGFPRTTWSRYLIKYGHPPGAWWRALDWAPAYALARAGFRIFGVLLLGRWGNKLAFVAERDAS